MSRDERQKLRELEASRSELQLKKGELEAKCSLEVTTTDILSCTPRQNDGQISSKPENLMQAHIVKYEKLGKPPTAVSIENHPSSPFYDIPEFEDKRASYEAWKCILMVKLSFDKHFGSEEEKAAAQQLPRPSAPPSIIAVDICHLRLRSQPDNGKPKLRFRCYFRELSPLSSTTLPAHRRRESDTNMAFGGMDWADSQCTSLETL
ncbi:hypothetical protein HDK64DRAFT_312640 [Phyllosticta capitalensis]